VRGRPDAGAPPLRGIYGGVPQEILDRGTRLRDFGVDAVWLGAGSFTAERLALLRAEGVQVYAEFNTLHVADYDLFGSGVIPGSPVSASRWAFPVRSGKRKQR
jgi:hypothetical protein